MAMNRGDTWQEIASKIGEILNQNFRTHPELLPLATAYMNFEMKYMIRKKKIKNKECIRISKERYLLMKATIQRQVEEIAALDYRIKTLSER